MIPAQSRTVISGGIIMVSQLALVNDWLDVNRRIKNCERLIEKYPGDASIRVELQELKRRGNRLKSKIDTFKDKGVMNPGGC